MENDIKIRDIDKLSYENTVDEYTEHVRPTYLEEELNELFKKVDLKIAELTYCEDFAIKMIKEGIEPEIISRVTRFSLENVKKLVKRVNKENL